MSKKKEPLNIPRMSAEERKTFVLDFMGGQIFTSMHVRNNDDIALVFMPVGLGAFADRSLAELKQIGCLYEYLKEASPRAINGMPCFFSTRIVHKEDWDLIRPVIEAEQKRMSELTV